MIWSTNGLTITAPSMSKSATNSNPQPTHENMSTTETPTPHAAILGRITESQVCEWLQARLDRANFDYVHGVGCIEICAWDERAPTFSAHGRVDGAVSGIGYHEPTIALTLEALAADLAAKKPNPEKLRAEAAALIAKAEALEAEGAE